MSPPSPFLFLLKIFDHMDKNYMQFLILLIVHTFSVLLLSVIYLSLQCTNKSVCVFLVATYTDGQPTENAEWFCKWLEEATTDFRYGKTYLKGLLYAVFGLGNSVYVGHYNTVRCGFCNTNVAI